MSTEKVSTEKKSSSAVIQTGGKQYLVEKGDIIDVELLGVETG
ncbi:50S ribosomal protein L21, partial [Candidatus Aerophobetes bacterium]